jgi:hypothetical protein
MNKDEPAHFVEAGIGDRMDGGNYPSYWRQFLFCSDGLVVCGVADNAEFATKLANIKRDERESWLTLPSREKIRQLAFKSCRGTGEQDDLNKAFAECLGITP